MKKKKILANQQKSLISVQDKHQLTNENNVELIARQTALDVLFKYLPVNFYWLNKEGRYLGCNERELKDLDIEKLQDLIGKRASDMLAWKNSEEVMRCKKSIFYEEKHEAKDIYYMSIKSPLINHKNEVIGIVGVSVDITDLKKTQYALEEQVKKTEAAHLESSQFASVATHEIRGPLSNSILILNSIKRSIESSRFPEVIPVAVISEAVEESSEALKSLDYLVRYLSLERTGLKARIEKCNIEYFLNNLISYDEKKPAKKIKYGLNYFGFLSTEVMFDHYHTEEMLSIIIKNAIRYSPENGFIFLGVEAREKNLIFTVRNEGSGISKEHLDNILKPIFSDYNDIENRFKKPSIKLSYVKKILEHLDGELLIDSKVNKWTEVKIILPFSYASNKKSEEVGKDYEKLIEPQKEKLDVLLVDDNALTLYLHKEDFGKYANVMDTAESGLKSIELCKKNKYDVIFMDITMPDISGILAMKKIKEIYKNDDTFFVAVTSHASEDNIYLLNREGFVAVLTKPVNMDDFEQCIQIILKIKHGDNN